VLLEKTATESGGRLWQDVPRISPADAAHPIW